MKFLQALFHSSHSLGYIWCCDPFQRRCSWESNVTAPYNETFLCDHSSNVIDGSKVAKGVGVLDPASILGMLPRDNSPASPLLALSLEDLQQHGQQGDV